MAFDKKEFLKQLEEWGEDHVRELLATGAMRDSKKVPLANEFLRRIAQERDEASHSEQMEIARSAKDAAWAAAEAARDAADEAKSANTRATIALIIAAISAGFAAWNMFMNG